MKKIFFLLLCLLTLPFAILAQNAAQQQDSLEIQIQEAQERLRIAQKEHGKESPEYSNALGNLGFLYFINGRDSVAIDCYESALRIKEQLSGEISKDNYYDIMALTYLYQHLNNDNKAIEWGEKALKLSEKVFSKNSKEYTNCLIAIAKSYSYIGEYQKAIELGSEALYFLEKIKGENHPDCALSLDNLAFCHTKLGEYQKAIELYSKALNIREKVLGKEHPLYAAILSNLAVNYSQLGEYQKAIELQSEALRIIEKAIGKEHPLYATSLNNLASIYADLGKCQKAIELNSDALSIQEKTLGKEHPDYATSLNNLASYYSDLGEYRKALKFCSEALKILEKTPGKGHPDYATSLSNLASYYSNLGEYQKSIDLQSEALRIRGKVLRKGHPDYANSLSNMAVDYVRLGEYQKAIELQSEALRIREKALGKDHPDYANGLGYLAICNAELGDNQKAAKLTSLTIESSNSIILRNFSWLTHSEREMFWNKYKGRYDIFFPAQAVKIQNDTLTGETYNAALISKGLLLNSEIEMSKLLQESGDSDIVKEYEELRAQRTILNKIYEKPIAERKLNTDSLEALTENLEKDLVRKSKTYGEYTRNLAIDWKQVQDRLGPGDLAVEFLSFPTSADTVQYAALTLAKADRFPKIIRLFDNHDLSRIAPDQYYSDSRLADLVWGRLADRMNGKKDIYFAPSGILHSIAIESLPSLDGKGFLSDRWNFHRLSSTRELALEKDRSSQRTACLYGGLEYDMNRNNLIASERSSATSRSRGLGDFFTASIADSLRQRAGDNYLPWTLTETQHISDILKKGRFSTAVLSGEDGTETSFKNLSGEKTGIIHVATHGFFFTEREAGKKAERSRLRFLGMENDFSRSYEDKALTRSGLLFSGARIALDGGKLPSDVDDGILTAKEISMMDLRGLDLVVLSACQTGLGDITGDGVFGLQRGFKKAGANTIMMSLWSVDDKATNLLMERFYKNLISGRSKEHALRDAQKHLRGYKEDSRHPYADPKYWAAFILLDAID